MGHAAEKLPEHCVYHQDQGEGDRPITRAEHDQDREGIHQVEQRNEQPPNEEMAFDDGALLPCPELTGQVQRPFRPNIGKDHETEQHVIARVDSPVAPVAKIGDGSMPTREPEDTGESDEEGRCYGEANQHIDDILNRPKALHRQQACKSEHDDNDDSLLPGRDEPLAVQILNIGDEQISQARGDQHAGKPGTKAGEETRLPPNGLVRPVVERTLVGKHGAQLYRGYNTRHKEGKTRED